MIEIKYSEVNAKLTHYWENSERAFQLNSERMKEQLRKYDSYGELLCRFSENLTNLDFFDRKIKRFNVNFEFVNLKNVNMEQAQNAIMNIGIA